MHIKECGGVARRRQFNCLVEKRAIMAASRMRFPPPVRAPSAPPPPDHEFASFSMRRPYAAT
jgi:hypothetical protein